MQTKLASLTLAVSLLSSASALAGSGNAILPLWSANTSTGVSAGTNVYVTNITSHTLNIGMTFYAGDGTVTSCPVTVSNLTNSNTQIAAGVTAQISVTCSTLTTGIARIQWSNQSTDIDNVGLVAFGIRYINYTSAGVSSHTSVPVNGSNPF
ncbi:hypothetical protein [Nitrospirillum iridis]|uniref:Uncharacterized protein n=1 Tax=Nitrospirillum iridis TaxID=765888 RepID=A0A7X0AZE1_9PROT|nr:hypothetical protein [Nitrospirillum iridis]MBB6252845.1 hypothetical protein [Nitrospirillum iridis]